MRVPCGSVVGVCRHGGRPCKVPGYAHGAFSLGRQSGRVEEGRRTVPYCQRSLDLRQGSQAPTCTNACVRPCMHACISLSHIHVCLSVTHARIALFTRPCMSLCLARFCTPVCLCRSVFVGLPRHVVASNASICLGHARRCAAAMGVRRGGCGGHARVWLGVPTR
jgi:hypothetical protein